MQDLRDSGKELGFFILQGVRVSLQGSYWEGVGEFKQGCAGSDTHLGKLFMSVVLMELFLSLRINLRGAGEDVDGDGMGWRQ